MKKYIIILTLLLVGNMSYGQQLHPTSTAAAINQTDSSINVWSGTGAKHVSPAIIGNRIKDVANLDSVKLYDSCAALRVSMNLISVGGIDTTALSNRINQRVKYTDTSTFMPTRAWVNTLMTNSGFITLSSINALAPLTYNAMTGYFVIDTSSADGVATKAFVYAHAVGASIDTTALSNRINLREKYTDTVGMSNRIELREKYTDTVGTSNRINLCEKYTDTVGTSNRIELREKYTDTVGTSNRIELRVKYSDSTTLYVTPKAMHDTAAALRTAIGSGGGGGGSQTLDQTLGYGNTTTKNAVVGGLTVNGNDTINVSGGGVVRMPWTLLNTYTAIYNKAVIAGTNNFTQLYAPNNDYYVGCANGTFHVSNALVDAFSVSQYDVFVHALGTGTVYSNSGMLTSTNPSDSNQKKNIVPLGGNYLDSFCSIPIYAYSYKSDPDSVRKVGPMAQGVERVFPQLVSHMTYRIKEPNPYPTSPFDSTITHEVDGKGLDQSAYIMYGMKALQEMYIKVQQLQARLDEDEALIQQLQNK